MTQYIIDADHSTVLVEARSSMGPIVFEARELSGSVDATVRDGVVDLEAGVLAHLEVALASLRSGNDLYDAELRRRIDARRFPSCALQLTSARATGTGRLALDASMTFHGSTRRVNGTVKIEEAASERLLVTGTKEFDIRDFGIPAPGVLMVKIYPDVQVQVFVIARADDPEGEAR